MEALIREQAVMARPPLSAATGSGAERFLLRWMRTEPGFDLLAKVRLVRRPLRGLAPVGAALGEAGKVSVPFESLLVHQ
jgi:hypothetical protein